MSPDTHQSAMVFGDTHQSVMVLGTRTRACMSPIAEQLDGYL